MRNKGSLFRRFLFTFGIFGAVFAYLGGSDLIDSRKPRYDINELMEADFKSGMIVEGELYSNLGAFEESYTTTNGIKTGSSKYCYMIPVGEKKYAGYQAVYSTDIANLDTQADETYSLLVGESTKEPQSVHILGKVTKMSQKTRGFLRSYMLDLGFTEQEVDSYILDYYIEQNNFSNALDFFLIGIVMLAIVIFIVVITYVKSKKEEQIVMTSEYTAGSNMGEMTNSAFSAVSMNEPEWQSEESFGSEENSDIENNTNDYSKGLGEGMMEQPKSGLRLKLKDD